jgi:flagellar hook-basal body complex protein FliE
MSDISNISSIGTADLFKQKNATDTASAGGEAFAETLKAALNEANSIQEDKEVAVGELATGEVKDLHQAAIAIGKAELSMQLMLEIRNKALSAYKEIGRTQL